MTSLSIDCISHTAQPLPSMPVLMDVTNADMIDGRIYVIGFAYIRDLQSYKEMYFRDRKKSFFYEPKGSKWEKEEMVNAKKWENACVVDDVLYYYDNVKNKLRAYDSEKKCWGVVHGVEEFLAKKRVDGWWETVSYGGKLVLFHSEVKHVGVTYFAEISLERNQQREIWGKVEWCDKVVIAESVHILKFLAVIL
ncbi:unnamed protein product [Microthlaspi erraticum]|uniref:FKB95-like N-terminal Kelch domain-containing protein n=1 Tax=Microthlaspi erraticum TaxID=1685480 RepID=A0A6D2L1F0_9BRAS|nr:unnamed protein product [Microthlaspi erraticum]